MKEDVWRRFSRYFAGLHPELHYRLIYSHIVFSHFK